MAKLAAARGALPLGSEEMVEALGYLVNDQDEEIRSAAERTLRGFDINKLRPVLESPELSANALKFLASWAAMPRELYQPLIFHENIPDQSLAELAQRTEVADVLELISLKQQSLLRYPQIIDAILANRRRTPEAERRAREARSEFFEKEFGVQVLAAEQRAQSGAVVEEEVAEEAPPVPVEEEVFIDDLAAYIEADLIDTGEALFEAFEEEFGAVDEMAGLVDGQVEFNIEDFFDDDEFVDMKEKEEFQEKVSVFQRIAQMTVKDKVKFALKGNREVRMILIRDPNRPVCAAVIKNPRITDHEIETISSLRSVHEEVLRLIGTNRAWTRKYSIVLNLVQNPKTPTGLSLNFLNRLQGKDLRVLGSNKNIPEIIRSMASRIYLRRQHG